MNKKYTICLTCGKVQPRTDINEVMNNKYIFLKKKIRCPYCEEETKQAATKNIKSLVKKLVPTNNRDQEILYLIGR